MKKGPYTEDDLSWGDILVLIYYILYLSDKSCGL